MDWKDRIHTDSAICGGRPHVKGTRLAVAFLLGLKAAGWSEQRIIESYPHLVEDDLRAVYAFAHALIEEESFLPLPRVA